MKRVLVKDLDGIEFERAEFQDDKYQAWIDKITIQGDWGEVGTYTVEVTDITQEISDREQARTDKINKRANAKQFLIDKISDLENPTVAKLTNIMKRVIHLIED